MKYPNKEYIEHLRRTHFLESNPNNSRKKDVYELFKQRIC